MRSCHLCDNDHDTSQVLQHLSHLRRLAYTTQTLPNLPAPNNVPHNSYRRRVQPGWALLRQGLQKECRYNDLQDAIRFADLPGCRVGDWRRRF